jgi:glycosyltransferase involved in cell wall biosynthesis
MSAAFEPIWVTEVDLDGPARELVAPDGYQRVRCLLRRAGEPVVCVEHALERGRVSVQTLAAQLPKVSAEPAATEPPIRPVSVVVCTRDRPRGLAVALASVLRCDPAPLEVVVVDSAPRTEDTARVVEELADGRVRLVREPRGGLSRARNLGVSQTRGDVIAFTDDDVRVDRAWLLGLLRGFARAPHVGCVTGAVHAGELETPAQLYFERKAGWSGPGAPRLYDLDHNRVDSPLYPYLPGTFGAGANFAVTRSLLASIGPFDEALGVGAPAAGGEDLDLFLRVLRAGMAVAHEPTAVVWHYHRREMEALRHQLVGYGSGLSALAAKLLSSRETSRETLSRVRPAFGRVLSISGHGRDADRISGLRTAEAWGLLVGPPRYLRGRLEVSR